MLGFDGADDVQLRLRNFIPQSTTGNVLITTRNRQLRTYTTTSDEDGKVGEMGLEDAKALLLARFDKEERERNRSHALEIVKVHPSTVDITYKPTCKTGPSLLRSGHLAGQRLHLCSLRWVICGLFRTPEVRTS